MAVPQFDVLSIKNQVGGTQVVDSDSGPTLVINLDTANTVYLHNGNAFATSDGSGVFPLAPGQAMVVDPSQIDEDLAVYAICAPNQTASLGIVPGGVHFFQPTSRLTIPTGATSGQRIVIDGAAGTITMYSAANNVTGLWSATGQSFSLFKDGNSNSYMKLLAGGTFGPEIHFNPDATKFSDGILSGNTSGGTGGTEEFGLELTSGAPLGFPALFSSVAAQSGSVDGTLQAQALAQGSQSAAPGQIVTDAQTWTALSLNGSQRFSPLHTPQYEILSDGLVKLRGGVQPNPAGNLVSGTVYAFLPVNPHAEEWFTCAATSLGAGQNVIVKLATNGNLSVTFNQTGYVPTWFSLDGIVYTSV